MTTTTNSRNNHRSSHRSLFRLRTAFRTVNIAVCSRFFVVEQRARTLHHARVIFAKIMRSFCGDCEMTAEIMCSEYKIDIFFR